MRFKLCPSPSLASVSRRDCAMLARSVRLVLPAALRQPRCYSLASPPTGTASQGLSALQARPQRACLACAHAVERCIEEAEQLGELLLPEAARAREAVQRWRAATVAEARLTRALRCAWQYPRCAACQPACVLLGICSH